MPPTQTRGAALLHPLHAILLGFPIALFTTALLSDITYLNSTEIQWSNFAQWLIAGALVSGGIVLLWAAIGFFRNRQSTTRRRALLYLVLLAGMWIIGLVNAFQHSRDGWSSVGTVGLMLSILSTLLALAAGWVAYSSRGDVR